MCVLVCVCVLHSSLSERKVGSNKSNSVSIAVSSYSLGFYQLTSPVIGAMKCIPFVLVTRKFWLGFAATGLFLYYYTVLAGVPGVARDDQWRNLIAFFPLDNERD